MLLYDKRNPTDGLQHELKHDLASLTDAMYLEVVQLQVINRSLAEAAAQAGRLPPPPLRF